MAHISTGTKDPLPADTLSREAEQRHLQETLSVIRDNLENYGDQVRKMKADIDEMLEHYHDDDAEVYVILNNTITLHDHMKRALIRNEKALAKPYFGRIDFYDKTLNKEESLYIGRGGVSKDATHQVVIDWRAPVANAYYENGLGECSYTAPDGKPIPIDLKRKRTYEIENGTLLDYFDSEVIANDDLLTKYLARNKQAVLGEIVATIQKEQNEIIRRSPYHNIIVQGVAGSGKTTVAMHRISFILYNYEERFKPDDFYIVGSNRILLHYITGVLPDLDVYGVRQMTMEQLFVRLLYEDWDEKKYRIRQGGADTANAGSKKTGSSSHDKALADAKGTDSSVRGSTDWFLALKAFCDELEWNTVLRDSIYLNRRQFVEGIRNGKPGVYDLSEEGEVSSGDLVLLVDGAAVERYIRQNPGVSLQSKINMLNERLINKVKEEFWGKGISYTDAEKKAILKAFRGRYGGKVWKRSIYDIYRDFLYKQIARGYRLDLPGTEFDVYDLASLAYIYKRIKETEVVSEAHHIVIDEAQDYGMMAYRVLDFCIRGCTYTIMGDVSQNIHFGLGLNDWEELKNLLLADEMASFNILKKSYRNTIEISEFAAAVLRHRHFPSYPAEPIIRHGNPVCVEQAADRRELIQKAASVCKMWQEKGYETIAVICRNQKEADCAAKELGGYIEVMENDLEKAEFGAGILVLPVEYTKGLEFDAVLILDPSRTDYPSDDGHARLLYVAATRALHELSILHLGDLTGLIADPAPAAAPSRALTTTDKKDAPGVNQASPTLPGQPVPYRLASTDKSFRRPVAKAQTAMQISQETAPISQKSAPISQETAPMSSQAASPKFQPAAPAERSNFISSEKLSAAPSFGDMPPTEKLRPAGHAKTDLSIRWFAKQPDGLSLQSRYGTLRLSPVGSGILRVTFAKSGGQIQPGVHPLIAVNRTEKYWMYRENGNFLDLTTDELLVRLDKSTGAIRYMTRDKTLLLEEREKECRLLENIPGTSFRAWLYLNLNKNEHLYGFGDAGKGGIPLRSTARYLSGGKNQSGEKEALPFLISDKGYALLPATKQPVICCDLPTYGSCLIMENVPQMDFYFIAGKNQENLINAYNYLCGI